MKRMIFLLTMAVLVMTACNSDSSRQSVDDDREVVEITHSEGVTEVPVNPQRVVVLDFASLENIGLINAPVVGLTKLAVPSYLKKYEEDESIVNVGSLVEVNLEKINELQPDLILAGGRLAESYKSLSRIAPTIITFFDMDDPLGALQKDLSNLGLIFQEQEIYSKVYSDLMAKIEKVRNTAEASDEKALVVLHNQGRFSAYGSGSRFGLIHDILGLKEASPGLDTHLHGTRASSEFIKETNPDILFIVDRSAAIGDQPLNREDVENELIRRTNAYEKDQIIYLNSEAWYLSGTGGITSINIMVDEISQLLDPGF